MDLNARRNGIYQWLRDCLIGPGTDGAVGTLRRIKPLERYQTGILFPIVKGEYGLDPEVEIDDEDDAEDAGDEDGEGQKIRAASQPKRRFVPPSSVGLSFFICGGDIRLQLVPRALRYTLEGERDEQGRFVPREWRSVALGANDSEVRNRTVPEGQGPETWREPVFDGRGELFVRWRPLADGWLVTASLSNTRTLNQEERCSTSSDECNQEALFEVELLCVIDAGEVGPYPGVQYSRLSDEEQELELQYRRHRVYAIGHGAAVDWDLKDGRVVAIRTEFLPRVEVPQVSADVEFADRNVLLIRWLADSDTDRTGCCDALDRFVSAYVAWVQATAVQVDGLVGEEQAAAKRIHGRMSTAAVRMRAGIGLLRRDPLAAKSFALANRAMESQMAQGDRAARRPPRDYRWRPFQLAFLLLALESTINEDSEYRETLDLIWFPTGGGKTEAYLGLMAFLICWRRLKFGVTGGGTTVLMRYTLRLTPWSSCDASHPISEQSP
jgi:hypothetical protein